MQFPRDLNWSVNFTIQLNFSTMATLCTEKSGRYRVYVWTVRQKSGHCKEVAITRGLTITELYFMH